MRIVLACATHRGYLFLRRLAELAPASSLAVFSFKEEPWEPPFLDDIRGLTLSLGGELHEARQVGGSRHTSWWESTEVDLMFVVNWRYLIPPQIYRRPRYGTFVFHDSLLPECRGFSPTVWAMINGEDHTGVTLFEIVEEVDSGDIVDQQRVPIGPDDTIREVTARVTQAYLDVLERNLEALGAGRAPRRLQDHSRATYTCKRTPEDNQIDWSLPSLRIYNLIRAVTSPYPGAFSYLGGQKVRIWSAQRLSSVRPYAGRVPGRVVEVLPGRGTVVLTGDGALLLNQVQPEGSPLMCASAFLNSLSHTLGR